MIYTIKEFHETLNWENPYRLSRYLNDDYKENKCYTEVSLPKRNGGERLLHVPNKNVKRLQYAVVPFLEQGRISSEAFAYQKGKSVKDNAAFHKAADLLVKLDIEDFFGSISFSQVYSAMNKALASSDLVALSCCKELSWYFTKYCTLRGSLPQGAPTSPLLSNLVFAPLDKQINSYCTRRRIRYTRYSDDLIFSGRIGVTGLIHFVKSVLRENGFTLNGEKTLIAGAGRQKKVTGIIVNERLQVDKKNRKKIRQEMYYIRKYGLPEHLERIDKLRKRGTEKTKGAGNEFLETGNQHFHSLSIMVKELQRLIGRIDFVLFVDPKNHEFMEYKQECLGLMRRIPRI